MSGDAIGFEALARWQCPKRGMVPPRYVYPYRRGEQSHHIAGRMGSARGLSRSRILAAAAANRGQYLPDPVPPWRLAKGRALDPA